MSDAKKLLITVLPDDAVWRRLRDKFREYDVEADSEDENIYDLRAHDVITDDEVYVWGRDGWSNGWWHGRLFLERANNGQITVMAEQGTSPDCMSLLALRKKLLLFMDDCMHARSLDQEPPS